MRTSSKASKCYASSPRALICDEMRGNGARSITREFERSAYDSAKRVWHVPQAATRHSRLDSSLGRWRFGWVDVPGPEPGGQEIGQALSRDVLVSLMANDPFTMGSQRGLG